MCKADPISAQKQNVTLCLHSIVVQIILVLPGPQQQRNTLECASGLDTVRLRSIMPYLCLWVLCYILGACSRVKINAVNTAL